MIAVIVKIDFCRVTWKSVAALAAFASTSLIAAFDDPRAVEPRAELADFFDDFFSLLLVGLAVGDIDGVSVGEGDTVGPSLPPFPPPRAIAGAAKAKIKRAKRN